ncbi:MAG: hypothetical protein IKU03_06110 [Bacteroidales bacterium]|nr:hypothetical protein [Bacteroidales bacterium]
MSKAIIYKLFCVCLLCVAVVSVYAQNGISQPYSYFGVGIINKNANGTLDAMGGTAIAMQDPYTINFRNPASYAAFDSLSFVGDVGASIVSSTLKQGSLIQKNSHARPDYIAIGLPVTRHWRTSVGLVPFSSVGYDVTDKRTIDSIGNVSYDYSGTGGLYQLYWGNAFRICKGLSIGLNTSYLFGHLSHVSNTAFEGSNFLNSVINDDIRVNGIHLTAGIQYFFRIKEKHRIGLGVTYSNSAYVWTKEDLLINYYTGSYSVVTTYDTILHSNQKQANLRIPQSVGAGISYSFNNSLIVAADVSWHNWAEFKYLNFTDSMTNSITSSLGVQYVPDPISTKFFKRMAFRAGVKYSTGELVLRNRAINELGVTLGIGFPLTTFNTHSSLSLMFEYGKMGTLADNLIKQNYFRLGLNFTLQERWYQRKKLE